MWLAHLIPMFTLGTECRWQTSGETGSTFTAAISFHRKDATVKLKAIEAWSAKEGMSDRYNIFLKALKK